MGCAERDRRVNEQDRHNLFSELVASYRGELYAYILSIVRNWEDADDLFQSVCLVLWSKFASFEPGTSFFAWARQTAKIEVRCFLRKKQSPSHVSEQLLDTLAETLPAAQMQEPVPYMTALERCRAKLNAADEELLELRYVEDLGSREIADRVQRPQQSVCQSLKRIRRWLLECVRGEMARQEHSGRELP
jgi:RNA polymerase sigma-70 factor (ECF subfamily)